MPKFTKTTTIVGNLWHNEIHDERKLELGAFDLLDILPDDIPEDLQATFRITAEVDIDDTTLSDEVIKYETLLTKSTDARDAYNVELASPRVANNPDYKRALREQMERESIDVQLARAKLALLKGLLNEAD